jgi:light-regulated signal transduction histidine kinase (bacteriophytochrome)/CheY-like chemotaxis protein
MSDTDIDITLCDQEPIHLLGAIQSFGFLLTVSSDWRIGHASTNLSRYLDVSAQAALGRPLDGLLLPEAMHSIRGAVQALASPWAVERLFNLALQQGRHFDLALHRSGDWVVIEAEPSVDENKFDAASSTRTMIARLQGPSTVLELCQEAARQVRALTGFDRVMVYRFDEDGSGEVVAERAQSMLQPYLGLHYPASDIPRQARELYLRNTLRLIADVDAPPVAIEMAEANDSLPLDLTLSGLRSVSPIHLEYLRNMGVAASMSISILQQGKLWGLIVCHHGQVRELSLNLRTTAELFGQMFSFMLESRQRDMERVQERFRHDQHDQLMASLGSGGPVFDMLETVVEKIRTMIGCDGFAMNIDGRFRAFGVVPEQGAMNSFRDFVGRASSHTIFSTDYLIAAYPPAAAFEHVAAGVLVIPILSMAKSYLYFFREPRDHTREWAGDPRKVLANERAGNLLRPRTSFAAWTEQVRGHCKPWSLDDLRTAEHLCGSLREVFFKKPDSADLNRVEESAKHEMLIAELNHRVRNILGLVRGMVSQSHDGVAHVEDFIESISGRIQALAHAHDQITAVQWADAPLRKLVEAEAMAYLMPGRDRLIAIGPGVLLNPYSFPTVALVIHELTTNSAKHGALSTLAGHVVIEWSVDGAGSLGIRWEEKNGPLVHEPVHRGFGTTLINRSIPFDLKGTATIEYAPRGLIANFTIPAAFFCLSQVSEGPALPQRPVKLSQLEGDVLVMEDNLIIALDVEDILLRLGAARVHTASSVRAALQIVSHSPITFALLDFSMGKETSTEVALLLHAKGIPFLFATGYGKALHLPAELSHVRVISKPYNLESFREAEA